MSKTHIVQDGDCLASIARQYGFSDYKTLYDHPENQELKSDRPNPNMLAKGDRVVIPDHEDKEIDISLDSPVKITVSVPEVKLCVVILDEKEQPAANKKYRLSTGKSGTTDGSGKIDVPIPPDLEECKLEVWIKDDPEPPRAFRLRIGRLADVKTVQGVQGRLANLGYYRGKLDGKAASVTSALKNFQAANKLTVNGDPADKKTQDKLVAVHDGG
jgi:N-acetylmuramoyl-L-alanine amidase